MYEKSRQSTIVGNYLKIYVNNRSDSMKFVLKKNISYQVQNA